MSQTEFNENLFHTAKFTDLEVSGIEICYR